MKAPADFKNELNECLLRYRDDPEVLRACRRMAQLSRRTGVPYYDCWYNMCSEMELVQRARAWMKGRYQK